jgi:type III secretion protein C
MRKTFIGFGLGFLLLSSPLLHGEEVEDQYTVNFQDVPMIEFIRYVSRISHVNFIFNQKELQFNVSLSTGKAVDSGHVLKALVQILKVHGMSVVEEEGYLVVQKAEDSTVDSPVQKKEACAPAAVPGEALVAALDLPPAAIEIRVKAEPQFLVYKLQYHGGGEIEEAIKKIAGDLHHKPDTSPKYLSALESVQWVKTTNSLICSGEEDVLPNVKKLIESLDAPLKQVFIEILVIETDVRKSVDFGLQWAAGGKYQNSVGMGGGNFPPGQAAAPFAKAFQGVNAQNPPTGTNQFPIGGGFDFGVIGDIILHKGKSYFSLGSLISALQIDGESTIVLNQKIITQDNKNSTIFVGDNIPFTGSIVQTVGSSQQTTANVEYRDIGVLLNITPKLGENNIITLDLTQEITEALPTAQASLSTTQVAGIQTTKTNMMTHVHVPDKHFLVLSGMIRNTKVQHKAGLPCLGGLPLIGAAFSKNQNHDEKRNVIIFVRPRIIHSMEEYQNVTKNQEEVFRGQTSAGNFDEALKLAQ